MTCRHSRSQVDASRYTAPTQHDRRRQSLPRRHAARRRAQLRRIVSKTDDARGYMVARRRLIGHKIALMPARAAMTSPALMSPAVARRRHGLPQQQH